MAVAGLLELVPLVGGYIVYSVGALVGLLVIYLIGNEYVRWRARIPGINGPRGLPVIGNLHQVCNKQPYSLVLPSLSPPKSFARLTHDTLAPQRTSIRAVQDLGTGIWPSVPDPTGKYAHHPRQQRICRQTDVPSARIRAELPPHLPRFPRHPHKIRYQHRHKPMERKL